MPSSKLLASLADAVSGSAGTAISTTATYPLDLVSTRLKVQRRLRADTQAKGASSENAAPTSGVVDTLRDIAAHEGGPRALFRGVGADAAKSAADSFLFFWFYGWLRAHRLGQKRQRGGASGEKYYLGAAEELVIGALAGAWARAFTTPVANVVTRKQAAGLAEVHEEDEGGGRGAAAAAEGSLWETLAQIRRERGFLGLWAGYSASLVLTLNPSITFFLQQALGEKLPPRYGDGVSSVATFLVAAVSKAFATAVTYPFQTAKTRLQVSLPDENSDAAERSSEEGGPEKRDEAPVKAAVQRVRTLADETIFGTVASIGKKEGVRALYDGMSVELLKAFLSHGMTMVSKDVVHKLLLRLYFAILAFVRARPGLTRLWRRNARMMSRKGLTAEDGKAPIMILSAAAQRVIVGILDTSQWKITSR